MIIAVVQITMPQSPRAKVRFGTQSAITYHKSDVTVDNIKGETTVRDNG